MQKEMSMNSPQTLFDEPSTVNSQLSLEAESDPKRRFKMIDAWLREYERRNRDWPSLARMCIEVKVNRLWKHGGYKDWSHWVLAAARCARRRCSSTLALTRSCYRTSPMRNCAR